MFFCILHTFLSAAGSPLWFKKKSDKMSSFPIMRLCHQSKPAWRCLNIVVCDRWAVSVTQSSSTCSLFFLKVTDPPPVIAYSGGVQHSSKWEICKSAYFCFAKGFICVEGFSHRAQDLWGLQSSTRLSLSWRKKTDQRKFNLNDSESFFLLNLYRDVQFYIVPHYTVVFCFSSFCFSFMHNLCSKTALVLVCFWCCRPLP